MPRLVRGAAGVVFACLAGMIGQRLGALDLDPKIVSSSFIPGGPAVEVTLSGNYAYVVAFDSGLHIADITDPTRPLEVGTYRSIGSGMDVAISGSYAYLATQRRFDGTNYVGGGLEIIDISDPANPWLVGRYTNVSARAVVVLGSYAYVAQDGSFSVIDISNPANPQIAASAPSIDPWSVALSGSYAYVVQLNRGLQVFDISDPANPDPVGVYATNGYFQDVVVSASYAYLADVNGVHIVDISQPTAPQLTGRYTCFATDVALSGAYICAVARAGDSGGLGALHILRVSNPANPQLVSRYDANAAGVALSSHYAYLLDGNVLAVLDVADPATPALVGGYSVQRNARDLVLSGQHAYVADGIAGLEIFDVSNPADPERVGGFFIGAAANSLAVASNRAYIVAPGGLHILDIANPADPRRLARYSIAADGRRVRVSGTLAYLAAKSRSDGTNVAGGGLDVIDVSNPANPQRIGSYPSSNAVDVAIAGSYAYLTVAPERTERMINAPGALEVLDISNPANPRRVGRYVTAEQTQAVAVSGTYAYVTDGTAGLHVIDISNPADPHRVSALPVTGYASASVIGGARGSVFTSLTVSSNRCFLAEAFLEFSHGIQFLGSSVQIVDVSNPLAPRRVGSLRVSQYDTPQYIPGAHSQGMAASPTHLFVAGGKLGLQTVDISTPASSQVVGRYNSPAGERGLTVAGNYAYVATHRYWTGSNLVDGGLQIIDIADPVNPRLVGAAAAEETIDVAVSGANAYAIAAPTSLVIYDISDPANPKGIGRYDVGAFFLKLALQDNYAYVVASPASGRGGLHIIDISNPADPRAAGRYDGGGEALNIAVSGSYAYMTQERRWTGSNFISDGLQIIDVSNPLNPQRAGSYDTSSSSRAVALSGSFAYLVGDGLHVLDISNPAGPRCVGTNEHVEAETAAVFGGFAYLITSEGLMQMVDVRDPTQPKLVGANSSFTAFFADVPSSITVAGGKVFLTTASAGLHVLHRYEPIRFQQVSRNNGMIRLQIAGPPNVPGRLERSGDLRNWANWLPVNFAEDLLSIIDPDTNSSAFYRIVVP